MVLIQLLLPLAAPGLTDPAAAFAVTRAELSARFSGLTAYVRAPARGVWTTPDGRQAVDDVVMVEVVTRDFDRGWWRSYATLLAARFHQESMHVRALTVQMLGDGP